MALLNTANAVRLGSLTVNKIMLGIQVVWSGQEWSPLELFASGEQGAWYDPSDFDRYMGEFGPELSEDLDFADTTKWIKDTGWSVTGGQAVHNGAAAGYIRTLCSPVVGKTYVFTIDIVEMPAGAVITVYCGESNSKINLFVAGVYSFALPALSTGLNFAIRSSNATGLTTRINSFSIKEVTSISTATMFQDAAGTIPVTALEQSVGRILDKSGRGNHASQVTAASRPVLSARKNLLTKTEAQSGNGFGGPSYGVTAVDGVQRPMGVGRVLRRTTGGASYSYGSFTPLAGVPFVVSYYVRRADGLPLVFNAPYTWASPLNDCTVIVSGVGTPPANMQVTDAGGGWYRVAAAGVWTSGSTTHGFISFNYTVNLDVVGIQLEYKASLPATSYQRVNTATDYDTVGFPRYLKFDGVDDVLTMSAATAPGTCTVVRSVPGVGAEITTGVSVGTSHNLTQSFHGLLIVNRALTPQETTDVTNLANDLAGVTP